MLRRQGIHRAASRPMVAAFSLVEVVISTVVVSLMLVAALNTVGMAQTSTRAMADRTRGMLLAQQLMAEIVACEYADPEYGYGSFGVGSDETWTGDRSLYDDVDDYDGWSASPPQNRAGNILMGLEGWTREVTVEWVDISSRIQSHTNETGMKRITVTVRNGELQMAQLTALRTAY